MFRLSVLALFTTSVALAAPVPKGKEKELYFPVTVGAKWVMVDKARVDLDVSFEVTETVTKVEEKDGLYTVTVESKFGMDAAREFKFAVSDKGVFRLPANGRQADPRPVLKLAAKAGTTWENETTGGMLTKHKFTAGKEEEVEVPAGKFKAVRVDNESTTAAGTSQISVWYAPGAGIIKWEAENKGVKSSRVLKSFTPGKEEKADDKKKDEPKKDK